MKFAIYDKITGKILQRSDVVDSEVFNQLLNSDQEIFLNCPPLATHIINDEPVVVIPPPQIPQSVEMRQARRQLIKLGLYATFLSALSQMDEESQVEAEYALTVQRTNPLTRSMIALFGWTEAQTDDYFIAASII